jgi:ABC-type multidrug transport system fused ATPase/permease subunit
MVRKFLMNAQLITVLQILNKRDRFKILIVMLLQIFLSILDLIGVAIMGLLGALSINGVQSRPPGDRVSQFLKIIGIDDNTFQVQAAVLGISAALILIFRTFISIYITKRVLFYLSRRGAKISYELIKKLMALPLIKIQQNTLYENLYSLTTGVSNITLGVIGSGVVIIADLSLLIIMSVGLFIVDPTMAIGTILFFATIGLILYKKMHKKVERLGLLEAELNVKSNEKITEVLTTYRESVVRNRREFYAKEIGEGRLQISNILAEQSFMPNISKYVIESAVILGALAISAVQFLTQDAARAVATLAIFLAAGTRIAPAVLRVQQGALTIKRNLGSSVFTLNLINQLKLLPSVEPTSNQLDVNHSGFVPSVKLSRVTFRYPNSDTDAISDLSLEIHPGQICAVVGSSGAGKSTLIDLILGVIEPDSGKVEISNASSLESIKRWPGAIGYVPQDVIILNGSIRSNIGLGFPDNSLSETLINDAINTAQLSKYVNELNNHDLHRVGDRGSSMSGGQRQRLGIARALYTKPKLLVLDEATSALDGDTEASISKAISELKGQVTVIQIAHRLSTVRAADQVIYLDNGKIISSGTFDEVRSAVPDFDRQASLMGL